ncbi:uncharacterized protein LOC130815056 [Amaranthus tricolor]|uniref:uncharacterized protein LOC130815056 n=1 Tax=Amaranthus tricolor TaxID=29722 RepID=UPI00258A490A|nr:uncharacterized protein LOC130815056 [Amaranthus tricolor]
MPRPGPRPYECVRRAWHSDTLQPIRGSIIQQIFRVVIEAHSSVTRKNREWQEKLPLVVFKAEEIMYSKANSGAEYVDPETLWERLNDAVDTIIRRDESTETETGPFLQPCIEAALVLGCHPVKASRSQRNSNPRSYLNPRLQEHSQAAAPAFPDNTNYHRSPPQPPNHSGSPLNLSRSTMGSQATTSSISGSQMVSSPSYIATQTGPYPQPKIPGPRPSLVMESNSLLNFGSVNTLYYGSQIQNVEPHFGYRPPQKSNQVSVIFGTPVGWQRAQPTCITETRNLLLDENVDSTAEKNGQVTCVVSREMADETDCDLSLRLGPSDPGTSVGRGFGCLSTDDGSSSYVQCSSKNTEICFFPSHIGNGPSDCSDHRLEQKSRVLDINAALRKRKAPDQSELEDGNVQWLREFQPNSFHGQYRWPASTSLVFF